MSDPGSRVDSSYCFKWANYQSHLSEVVRQLLDEKCMVDVTLVAGSERIQAHRIVLGACSTLFQEILSQVNDEHTVIILSDIAPQDVRSIVEFSYNGEVRIPVENINNLLDAAHSLKICGLMEIEGLDETEVSNERGSRDEESYVLHDITQMDEEEEEEEEMEAFDQENSKNITNEKKRKNSENDSDSAKRKRRKSVCKREYTDTMLANAIADVQAGKSLLEAAAKNNIPRSTLYMRAKTLGITLNPARNEYTLDDMRGAIQAVLDGSSLQQASDCHGIPKTVLWRRIQKEGYHTPRQDTRKNYGTERREAAVKALERGETLTKVANEYKIPKTTLFRDKTRLIDQGKLPSTFWKKRKTDGEDQKRSRLEEAVAACKDGKMSQATASATYQIPKTTIWRRLQKEQSKNASPPIATGKQLRKHDSNNGPKIENVKTEELNDGDFEAYCDDTEMNITYIDESNLSENPVIILASGDADNLNLPNRSVVVVQEGTEDNFISCGLDLDETAEIVEHS